MASFSLFVFLSLRWSEDGGMWTPESQKCGDLRLVKPRLLLLTSDPCVLIDSSFHLSIYPPLPSLLHLFFYSYKSLHHHSILSSILPSFNIHHVVVPLLSIIIIIISLPPSFSFPLLCFLIFLFLSSIFLFYSFCFPPFSFLSSLHPFLHSSTFCKKWHKTLSSS